MGRQGMIRLAGLVLLAAASWTMVSCRGAPSPQRPSSQDLASLTQSAAEPMAISYSPVSQRPSFMRGRIPLTALGAQPSDTGGGTLAFAFIRRHGRLFGVDTTGRGLQLVESRADRLGMRHVVLQQKVENVPVYNAIYAVHVDPRTSSVVAVTSSLVPDIRVNTTTPQISGDSARAIASAPLLRGQATSSQLVVHSGPERSSRARLGWLVEVSGVEKAERSGSDTSRTLDTVPVRRDVIIDATNGKVIDILDRFYTARDRKIYTANNTYTRPGTLRRSEGDAPVGDAEVDNAYDFLGSTYTYYSTTHGRDSYDNTGATMIATVHYGSNYSNAGWDGAQMVFGDGYVVLDVTAHELTHAVTERTANLEYRWQSGALNESFSDIFGAMVDRNDWLIGEDMPIGAIRDLENPGAFGDPGHTSGWVATCSDNQGVHTNSGIFNKAFVNIATAIGNNDAEQVFYRALTTPGYLSPQATFEDARGAAIQSAVDLFGTSSPKVTDVTNGFNAVGLDGVWQPSANSCTVVDLSPIAFVVLVLLLLVGILRARAATAASRKA